MDFKLYEEVIRRSDGKRYKIVEHDSLLPYQYRIVEAGKRSGFEFNVKGFWVTEQMISKI